MMPSGGFDIRNLFQSHTMALLIFYLVALAGLMFLGVSFRGSVVV